MIVATCGFQILVTTTTITITRITKRQNILMKGRIACRAVIQDWLIPFAVYTAAETPNTFQWARQTPKIAPSHGRSWTHLTMVHWAQKSASPPPNGISIGSAIFAGLMDMTDSQTYRQPYSIASNGSHLAIAVRLPNNSNHDMAIATVLPVHLV